LNLNKLLSENYNIGNIINIQKTKHGSGNTHIVNTSNQQCILKDKCRFRDIQVEQLLNDININILYPGMILNNNQEYLTNNEYVLYEYIDGETYKKFGNNLTKKAVEFIADMNKALNRIEGDVSLPIENDWDKISDESYLLNNTLDRVDLIKIPNDWKELIKDCMDYLNKNYEILKNQNKQLIHIDPGPNNFLIKNNEIAAILDFTAAINHELLSLSQFVYWNYLWFEEDIDLKTIQNYLKTYYNGNYSRESELLFYLKIIEACLYRILGPLFEMEKENNIDQDKLQKRVKLLKWSKMHLF
jgi:Ser/Thr protein kinase RdoA (MazF antagonist)